MSKKSKLLAFPSTLSLLGALLVSINTLILLSQKVAAD